jgi:apolipoprotein N-acyltransferase
VEQLAISRKTIHRLAIVYLMLWLMGLTYGLWRIHSLDSYLNEGSQLHVVALQPNFSFDRLVSNQTMGFSARQHTVQELVRDSTYGLSRFPKDSLIPRLAIWPESTFPSAYFKDVRSQTLVKDFARDARCWVLLHSVDWDEMPSGRRFYGISVLVGPDGETKGRYNKIFRIPFGEYLPGSGLFPFYANWLRKRLPYLSEFEQGKEFTVFHLSDDLRFSAPICFDIFSPAIIPGMVRNGANLAINLSNLIWFGDTSASDQMEMAARWKAIENRIPIFLVSNNGKSVLISSSGMKMGGQLGLFERGSITQTLRLKSHFSLYREYRMWIHLTFVLLFAVVAILGSSRGRIFDKD